MKTRAAFLTSLGPRLNCDSVVYLQRTVYSSVSLTSSLRGVMTM